MSSTPNLSVNNVIQENELSSGTIIVLYDNHPDIKERVDKMAHQVFRYCYLVLRDAKLSDFNYYVPQDLNLFNMVEALQVLSKRLDMLGGSEYETINTAINAREQLRRLKSMIDALREGDKDKYLQAIAELEKQAMP